jgi:hypothetical protein
MRHPTALLLPLLPACQVAPSLPEPSFEATLTDRYHCGTTWFVAADPDRTLRLGVSLPDGPTTTGSTHWIAEPRETELPAADAWVTLYAGECLWTPGCSDVVHVQCQQRVDAQWSATAGFAKMERDGEAVRLTLEDVVLEGDEGALPLDWVAEAPPWGE